jgi:NadR type nicotinamide-nucleotide adenylyltransferase
VSRRINNGRKKKGHKLGNNISGRVKTGIVIGKFYPPHKGHKFLIETACRYSEKVTVIVCDKEGQSIPGAIRAEWLKEMVPECEVVVVGDILADDDSKGWAEYTVKTLGYVPEAVFTSENYGERYARYMGSRHMLVDIDRKNVPVSATLIRKDPFASWEYIEPCVRAYYVKRICIVGAESTGTTTMAMALAEHFKTVWVPEYGRLYTEERMRLNEKIEWRTEDFIRIARKQNKMEDEMARLCNKVLICDTDSFATALWHERYMGYISPLVDELSSARKYDMYFLTDADIPFAQDGTRDGEHIRKDMHRRFAEELAKRNKCYTLLSGSREQRLKTAIEVCNKIISKEGYYGFD